MIKELNKIRSVSYYAFRMLWIVIAVDLAF